MGLWLNVGHWPKFSCKAQKGQTKYYRITIKVMNFFYSTLYRKFLF
jgi:hypothetical protein